MTVQDSIKRTLEIRASDAVESVRVLVNLRLGIRFSVLVQIQASIFYEIDVIEIKINIIMYICFISICLFNVMSTLQTAHGGVAPSVKYR